MQVFISHSQSDSPLAAQVSEALRKTGLKVWDAHTILDVQGKVAGLVCKNGSAQAAVVGPMTGRPLGPTSSVVAKHGRPVVVVMAVEEYERLKVLESGHVDSRPSTTGKAE